MQPVLHCLAAGSHPQSKQSELLGASVWFDVITALRVAMDKAGEHASIMLFLSVTV